MATKKVRELNYDDLGKEARLNEANGDVNTGPIGYVSIHPGQLGVKVGNAVLSELSPDDLIEID